MIKNNLNKDQFLKFSKKFQAKHRMPGGYGVGQPFEEDELIAIRWQTINFDTKNQTAKNLGFCSALMDYCGLKEINKITVLTIDYVDAEKILEKYFSGYLGEPNHFNLDVLQGAVDRIDDVIIILYPNWEVLKQPSIDWIDASCRLAMISHLAFKPNEINLDGVFGLLPILYYMSDGDVMTPGVWKKKLLTGDITSYPVCIDKFPPMWWGTPIADGVRIADTSRVRMGAYLSPGTTIMHEGFVNFNAGTLGSSMVEGRISAGVVVDNDSDVGGGASIMGTLSGGGKEKIIIGKNCLLGANSGIGISLGDCCTVEAGLYITAGKLIKVRQKIAGFKSGSIIKALQLSGFSDILFRQNSETGTVEAWINKKPNKLNPVLHS